MNQSRITDQEVRCLIYQIFQRQNIFKFKVDWHESKYYEFQVQNIDKFEMQSLLNFFGDMHIIIDGLLSGEHGTILNVRIQEKISC